MVIATAGDGTLLRLPNMRNNDVSQFPFIRPGGAAAGFHGFVLQQFSACDKLVVFAFGGVLDAGLFNPGAKFQMTNLFTTN
jgi:hypothetical protein